MKSMDEISHNMQVKYDCCLPVVSTKVLNLSLSLKIFYVVTIEVF